MDSIWLNELGGIGCKEKCSIWCILFVLLQQLKLLVIFPYEAMLQRPQRQLHLKVCAVINYSRLCLNIQRFLYFVYCVELCIHFDIHIFSLVIQNAQRYYFKKYEILVFIYKQV